MKLEHYLEINSLNDEQFAALVGRDRSIVNRWRRGKVRPDWDAVARITEATGGAVTANDFMPVPESAAPAQEAAQ